MNVKTTSLTTLMLMLTACSTTPIKLDTEQHIEMLQKDQEKMGLEEFEGKVLELSLEQALERGVKHNLDAQVSALNVIAAGDKIDLARLNALPSLNLSGNYIGRSNEGAASSRSVLTGTQSLEPSYSTEQYRTTQDLSMNWSSLNMLLAVSQAQNAKSEQLIAAERYSKVIQNIEADIYAAYFKALAAQKTQNETRRLIAAAERQMTNIDKAKESRFLSPVALSEKQNELSEALASLKSLQNEVSLSLIELKSLLSLPQDMDLHLNEKAQPSAGRIKEILTQDVRAQEAEALKNRPELREMVLQDNISAEKIREEILKTIPGAKLFFAINRDSNEFLQESQWGSFTISVEQNLASLLSYPARKRSAANDRSVQDAERLSLSLAILTQVHLARQNLDYLMNMYHDHEILLKNTSFLSNAAAVRKKAGFDAGQDVLTLELQSEIKRIQLYQSLADLQGSYAKMNNTLGRNLLSH